MTRATRAIVPGGNDQSDRSADRDAGKGDVAKIELVEEAFDRFGEERSVVTRASGCPNIRGLDSPERRP